MTDFLVLNSPDGDCLRVYPARLVCSNTIFTGATLLGHATATGFVCMDPDCLAFYEISELLYPITDDGETAGERGYFTCDACTGILDEKAELLDWLNAPIPTPAWVIERAKIVGLI